MILHTFLFFCKRSKYHRLVYSIICNECMHIIVSQKKSSAEHKAHVFIIDLYWELITSRSSIAAECWKYLAFVCFGLCYCIRSLIKCNSIYFIAFKTYVSNTLSTAFPDDVGLLFQLHFTHNIYDFSLLILDFYPLHAIKAPLTERDPTFNTDQIFCIHIIQMWWNSYEKVIAPCKAIYLLLLLTFTMVSRKFDKTLVPYRSASEWLILSMLTTWNLK